MRNTMNHTLFSAANANGVSTQPFFTRDFQHVLLDFLTASFGVGSTVTIKVQAAIGDAPPAFGSAASATNAWTFVQITDLNTGVTYDGSTGVTIAGANDFRKFEINSNGQDWVSIQLSAYNAPGTVTVLAQAYDGE